MKTKSLIQALRVVTALPLLAAGTAQADYLWLQRENTQATVRAGELHKPLDRLPTLTALKAVLSNGRPAPSYEQAADRYSFPQAEGDIRFIALRLGDDGVLTYFQARYGRQETTSVNDLELVPTESDGNTFRLFFKGRPANASRVNVETAAGWRKSLMPSADGSITLDTPIPGLYVLEVTAKLNNASIAVDGKKHGDVRYVATLSFEVPTQ